MGSSNHHSDKSSKRRQPSSHNKGSRDKGSKSEDEWADISDPEERRRRQNRCAQRKFREKTREAKIKKERDTQNQEHAGSSYHVPATHEVPETLDSDLSGLPWGSMSMKHVVRKGHESRSKKSSGQGDYLRDDGAYYAPPPTDTYPPSGSSGSYYPSGPAYATSSAGEDDANYVADPSFQYQQYYDDQGGSPSRQP